MTAGRIIFPGLMPAEDSNGDRIAGARAYFFLDDTTTPTTVYAAEVLTGPYGAFVEADSVGVWPPMWADTALLFNVSLTNGDGVPLPNGAWSGLGPLIDATLASVALVEEAAAAAADSAADAAASALVAAAAAAGGLVLTATSVSNVAIGIGVKVFALLQEADFSVGMDLYAADSADPATNRMVGRVTAYAHPLLTISVGAGQTSGAGAHAAWTIGLAAIGGVISLAGLTGVISAAAAKAALAIATTDLTDLAAFNAARDARAVAFAIAL